MNIYKQSLNILMMEELCHRAHPENQNRPPYIPVHLARLSPHWHTGVSDTFPAPEMARYQGYNPTPNCAHDLNHDRTCPLVPTAKVQHTPSW